MHALLALLLLIAAAGGDARPRPRGMALRNFDSVGYNLYIFEGGRGRHTRIGPHRTREICRSACTVRVTDTAASATGRPGEQLLIKHGRIGRDRDARRRR